MKFHLLHYTCIFDIPLIWTIGSEAAKMRHLRYKYHEIFVQ
jgi:hypothetical protein